MNRLAAAAALACGLTAGLAFTPAASAQTPMVKTQAPGFHRTFVGDFEVTAISDGTVKLPMLKLLQGRPEQMAEALKRGFLKEMVETSVNAYLINTGSKLVLIDAGAAGLFGPTLGNLHANLRASGYRPEQVDEIYITHMHPDHVGGLVADGKIAFPNATLRIDQRDVDFWLSKANMDAASSRARWPRSIRTATPASSGPSTARPSWCLVSARYRPTATRPATPSTRWRARARS
jgi:glyoxylase-like metal-dependent hydrolase (beta-lactamase superfamily II)